MPVVDLYSQSSQFGVGQVSSHWLVRQLSSFVQALYVSLFRINSVSNLIELPNAVPLVMYSDEFLTETFRLDKYGRPIGLAQASGLRPTAAAGAQAGGSPPAPVVSATASDARGSLTCGTGTSAATGALAVVTFAQAYAVAPRVAVMPANDATAALGAVAVTSTTTTFTIRAIAPGNSQANTVYAFNWIVVG